MTAGEDRQSRETPAQRRRRLTEVFGDVLPETTSDERDEVKGDDEGWLLEQRPPHHD